MAVPSETNSQSMTPTTENKSEYVWETSYSEIDSRVSFDCSSNTVEINLKSEAKQFLRYEKGKLVSTETSTIVTPFSIPHLVLNNIVDFEGNNIYRLLRSTFNDDVMLCDSIDDVMLCDCLTRETVYQAKKQAQRPLHISIDFKSTPQAISGEFTTPKEKDEWTCAICLEEEEDNAENKTEELKCSHVFHYNCLLYWLCENDTCPLCRTPLDEDDDDDDDEHEYYSD